jgi:hypothetical protein
MMLLFVFHKGLLTRVIAMLHLMLSTAMLCFSLLSLAQVRAEKMVLNPGDSFILNSQSDIIVADTLIMMDSSRIILNELKRDNFIHIKVAIIGNDCSIVGAGLQGQLGTGGSAGNSLVGPCLSGTNGTSGSPGSSGGHGINLFLYVDDLKINGRLIINLSGGSGGNGGPGGKGGDGSPGTLHCKGGNGAKGGDGGRGGEGGDAGNLVISSSNENLIRGWLGTKLIYLNSSGKAGQGGRGGYAGTAGLGPSGKNGRDGVPGSYGTNGLTGKSGKLTIKINQ